jgi:hypothetical protein
MLNWSFVEEFASIVLISETLNNFVIENMTFVKWFTWFHFQDNFIKKYKTTNLCFSNVFSFNIISILKKQLNIEFKPLNPYTISGKTFPSYL